MKTQDKGKNWILPSKHTIYSSNNKLIYLAMVSKIMEMKITIKNEAKKGI